MPSVVLLLGGECTGKSALAEALALSTGGVIVPEYLREFVEAAGRTPQREDQAQILESQQRRLSLAIATARPSDLIICDPAPLMTAVYSIQYFDDDTLLEGALEFEREIPAKQVMTVWCAPDIPWSGDGLHRDGPAARAATHDIIERFVLPTVAQDPVIYVSGPTGQRVQSVLSALNS